MFNAHKNKVRRNGKNYLLNSFILLILFFSFSSVLALPSQVTTQTSGNTIQIQYPPYEFIKQSSDFDMHFSVYNETQQLSNLTASCYFNFHDINGSDLLYENATYFSADNQFKIHLTPNLTSALGTHGYIISCTTMNEAGFASGSFDVVPGNLSSSPEFFYIIIFLLYSIAFIGFFGKNEWITIIGGMGMMALGLYFITNGIIIFRDTITDIISWTTIGLGAFFALYAGVSLIKDNY